MPPLSVPAASLFRCASPYHRSRAAQGAPRHPVHRRADGLHHGAARPAGDRGRSRLGQDDGDGGTRGVAGRHRPGRPRAGARPHLHQQGRRRTRRARPQGADQGRSHRPGRHRPGQSAGRAGDLHVPRLRRASADRPWSAHRPGAHVPAARRRHPLPARRARAARVTRALPGADPLLRGPRRRPPRPRRGTRRAPRTPRGAACVRRRAAADSARRQAHQRRSAQGARGGRRPP